MPNSDPAVHSGAMIALVVPEADKYSIYPPTEKSTPADDLHITLAYLGESDEISQEEREQILESVQVLADTANAAEALFPAATGVFPPDPEASVGEEFTVPYYAQPLPVEPFANLREQLLVHLGSRGVGHFVSTKHPVFHPHATLTYDTLDSAPDLSYLPTPMPVSFGTIIVKFGDEIHEFQLGNPEEIGPELPLTASVKYEIKRLAQRTQKSEEFLLSLYFKQRNVTASAAQSRTHAALERTAALADENHEYKYHTRIYKLLERAQMEPDPALAAYARARALAIADRTVTSSVPEQRELEALTASLRTLVADGNSTIARSLRAKRQLRDRYGRWIEMGGGVRFKISKPGTPGGGTWTYGIARGVDTANGSVKVELEDGRMVSVPATKLDQPKAIRGLKGFAAKVKGFIPKSLGRPGGASPEGRADKDARRADADALDAEALDAMERLQAQVQPDASGPVTGGHISALADQAAVRRNTEMAREAGKSDAQVRGRVAPFKEKDVTVNLDDIEAVQKAIDSRVSSNLPENFKSMTEEDRRRARSSAAGKAIASLGGLFNDRNDEKAKELRRAPGIKETDLESVESGFKDDQGIPSHEELAAAAEEAIDELGKLVPSTSPLAAQRNQLAVHVARANDRLLSGDDELPEYLDNLDLMKEFANSLEPEGTTPPTDEEAAFSAFAEDLDDIHKSAEGTDDVSAVRAALEGLSGQISEDGESQIARISAGLDRGDYLSDTTTLSKDLKSLHQKATTDGAESDQLQDLQGAIDRISSDEAGAPDAAPAPEAPEEPEAAPESAPETPEAPAEAAPEEEVEPEDELDSVASTNTLLADSVRAAMEVANSRMSTEDEKEAGNDAWTKLQKAKIGAEEAKSVDELDPAQIPFIDDAVEALDELDSHVLENNPGHKEQIQSARAALLARRDRLSKKKTAQPANSDENPPSTNPDDYTDVPEGASEEEAAVVAAREDALGAMADMISDPENDGEYFAPESDEGLASVEAYNDEIFELDPFADDPEALRDSAQVLEESGTGVVEAFSGDERVGPDKVDAFSKANEGLVDSLNVAADSKTPEAAPEGEESEESPATEQFLDHADALSEYAEEAAPGSRERAILENTSRAVANVAARLSRGDITENEASNLLAGPVGELDTIDQGFYRFGDDLAGTISDLEMLVANLEDELPAPPPDRDVSAPEAPETPEVAETPEVSGDPVNDAQIALQELANGIQVADIRDRVADIARQLGAIQDNVAAGDMTPEEAADFVDRATRNIDRILDDPRADRVLDANDGVRRTNLEGIRDSLREPAPEAPSAEEAPEIEAAPDVNAEQLIDILEIRGFITNKLDEIDEYIHAEPDFEAGQGRGWQEPDQSIFDSFDNSRGEIDNAFEEFDADQITAEQLQDRVASAINGWNNTDGVSDLMQVNEENPGPDLNEELSDLRRVISGEDADVPDADAGEAPFDPWANSAVASWVAESAAVEDLPGIDPVAVQDLVDKASKLKNVSYGAPYGKPKPRRSDSQELPAFSFGAQHGKQGVLNVAPPGSTIVAVEDKDRQVFNGNMSGSYLVRHPDGSLHVYHDQNSVAASQGNGITSRPMDVNDSARNWHSPGGTPFDGFDELRDAADSARRYRDKLEKSRDESSNEDEVAAATGELDRIEPVIEALEAEEEIAVDPDEPDELDEDAVKKVIQQLLASEHPLAGILAAGLMDNHRNGVPVSESDLQAIRDTVGLMAASPDSDDQDKVELNEIADSLDPSVLPDPDPSVDLPIDDLDDLPDEQSDYDAEVPVSTGQDTGWDDKENAPDPEGVDEAVKEQSVAAINEHAGAEEIDADNYEPKTPTQLEEEKHPLNIQQQVIADDVVADRKDVKVVAKAGTGKTSTLEAIARRFALLHPDVRIRYVAFNKDVQLEAEQRMPNNTESRTGHSLAWSFVGPRINKKFKGKDLARSNRDMARVMGLHGPVDGVSAQRQAKLAKFVVDRYSLSADDKIGENHFIDTEGKDLSDGLTPAAKSSILASAERMWEDIKKPEGDGKLSITQDHMRKMWALSKPDFKDEGFEVLFLDEAQDTPPVLAKVIADQTIQKVIVGDPDQAIYGFTGATNYLDEVELDEIRPLTTSYRFGKNVQDIANRFLQMLGSKDRVIGGGPEDKLVDDIEAPDAVLVRTNAGAVGEIIRELEAGRTVGVPKGTKANMLSLINTAEWLKNGANPRSKPYSLHEDLAEFDNWEDLLQAAQSGDNPVAAMVKKLLETHDVNDLKDTIKRVHDPADASVELNRTDSDMKIGGNSFQLNENLKRLDPSPGRFGGKGLGRFGFRFDRDSREWVFTGDRDAQDRAWARVVDELGGIDPNGNVEVDVTISTAHKSKGLEWKKVRIGEDFKGPKLDPDTGEVIAMPDPEELRLAYVAVTRAENELAPGSLSWIFDYTNENGDEPDLTPEPSAKPEATPEPSPEPSAPDAPATPQESGGESDVVDRQETDPREALPIEPAPFTPFDDDIQSFDDAFDPDVAIANVNRNEDIGDLMTYRDRILNDLLANGHISAEQYEQVRDAINSRIELINAPGGPLAAWERELLGLPADPDPVDSADAGNGTPNTPYNPGGDDVLDDPDFEDNARAEFQAMADAHPGYVLDDFRVRGDGMIVAKFKGTRMNVTGSVDVFRDEDGTAANAWLNDIDDHTNGPEQVGGMFNSVDDAFDALAARGFSPEGGTPEASPEAPAAPRAPRARAPRAAPEAGNHHPLSNFQKENIEGLINEIRLEDGNIANALQIALNDHEEKITTDFDLVESLGIAIDRLGGRARGGDHDPLMNRLQGAQAAVQRNMRRNWPDEFEMHLLRDVVGRVPDPIDDGEAEARAKWVADMHVGGENKRFPVLAPVEEAQVKMRAAADALSVGDRETAKERLAEAVELYKAGIQLRANMDRDDAFKRRLEDRLRESEWLLAALEQRAPNLVLGGRQVRGGGRFLPGNLPDRNGEQVHDGDIVRRVGRGVEGQEAIVIGVRGNPDDPDNEPYFSIRLISRDDDGNIIRNPDGSVAFDRRFLTAAINRVELAEALNPNRDEVARPPRRPLLPGPFRRPDAPAAPAAPAAPNAPAGNPVEDAYVAVLANLDAYAARDEQFRRPTVERMIARWENGDERVFLERAERVLGRDNINVQNLKRVMQDRDDAAAGIAPDAPDAPAEPPTGDVQVVNDMLLSPDREGQFGLVGVPDASDVDISDFSGVSDPRSINDLDPNVAPADPSAKPSMWAKWKGRAGAIAAARRGRPDAQALLAPGLNGAELKQKIAAIYGADVRRPRLDENGNPVIGPDGKRVYDHLTFGKKGMRLTVSKVTKTESARGTTFKTAFVMHNKDGQPVGTINRKLTVSDSGRITAENQWLRVENPDSAERAEELERIENALKVLPTPGNGEALTAARRAQADIHSMILEARNERHGKFSRTSASKKLRELADNLEASGLDSAAGKASVDSLRRAAKNLTDSDYRTSGFSTAFNRYMEDWYIANNRGRSPAQVGIHAALSNGAYVWAKNGFRFKGGTSNQVASARNFLRSMENDGADKTPLEKAHLASIKKRLDQGVPVLPFQLAMVGWQNGLSDANDDTWLGKRIMNSGFADWHGVKTLAPTALEQQVVSAYQGQRELRQRAEAGEFAAPVAPSFNKEVLRSRLANGGMSMAEIDQALDNIENNRSLLGLTPHSRRKMQKVVGKMLTDHQEYFGNDDPAPEGVDSYRSLMSIQRALSGAYNAEHPAQSTMGVAADLANYSWDDIMRGNVPNFRSTGNHEAGINRDSDELIHIPSGQIVYVKKNTYDPNNLGKEQGANAENDMNKLFRLNSNFPGIGLNTVSSTDNSVIISTKVGDAVGLVDRPKNAMNIPGVTDDLGNNRKPLANPSQVFDMLVADAVSHNIDRHNGNWQTQKDPDGNWHIFPIDHGLAAAGVNWGQQDFGQDAADFLMQRLLSQRLYGNTLQNLVRRLGSVGAKAELMGSINRWRELYENGEYRDPNFASMFEQGLDELETRIDSIIRQLMKRAGRGAANMRDPIGLPDWRN